MAEVVRCKACPLQCRHVVRFGERVDINQAEAERQKITNLRNGMAQCARRGGPKAMQWERT